MENPLKYPAKYYSRRKVDGYSYKVQSQTVHVHGYKYFRAGKLIRVRGFSYYKEGYTVRVPAHYVYELKVPVEKIEAKETKRKEKAAKAKIKRTAKAERKRADKKKKAAQDKARRAQTRVTQEKLNAAEKARREAEAAEIEAERAEAEEATGRVSEWTPLPDFMMELQEENEFHAADPIYRDDYYHDVIRSDDGFVWNKEFQSEAELGAKYFIGVKVWFIVEDINLERKYLWSRNSKIFGENFEHALEKKREYEAAIYKEITEKHNGYLEFHNFVAYTFYIQDKATLKFDKIQTQPAGTEHKKHKKRKKSRRTRR